MTDEHCFCEVVCRHKENVVGPCKAVNCLYDSRNQILMQPDGATMKFTFSLRAMK